MKLITLTCYAALAAFLVPSLQAAPPANDNFANAIVISGTAGTANDTNFDATLETGEPANGHRSIWYKWTAPATGTATVDTNGTIFDTMMGVYTGSAVNALSIIDQDDDSGTGNNSLITFAATSGVTYQIQVTSYFDGHAGDATVLNWLLQVPPANDNFASAEVISGDSGTTTKPMGLATTESGEPGVGSKSIWYLWTPTISGRADIDTIGSGNNTTLTVYTGTALNNLVLVASGDDGFGTSGQESAVSPMVTALTPYYIRVASLTSGTNLAGKLTWVLTVPPANDNFADAQTLTGGSGTVTGEMAGGSLESGETTTGSKSVWYTWTAPGEGVVNFNTIGAGNNTQLHVYTGASLGALSTVASSNDGYGTSDLESLVQYTVTTGTVYRIRVATYSSAPSLAAKLNWLYTPPAVNDSFANATAITDATGTTNANNLVSSTEPGEPGGGLNSIWYTWTAPASGRVVFHTLGSELDTTLGVYTGTALNALTQVAFNNDSNVSGLFESLVKLHVTAGTVYRIRVAIPSYGEPGPLMLTWLMVNQPANDDFANAQVITGASGTVSGNTFEATLEEVEPNVHGHSQSVWFAWTAPFTGVVTFDTDGSDFFSGLTVGNNPDLENLNIVSDSSDIPSVCTFPVISGTVYRICLSTYDEGYYTVNWAQEPTFVPSVISFGAASYNGAEGGPAVNITLNRNGGTTTGPVSCTLYTLDGSAHGNDYSGTYTTVNFADGITTASVSIPILQDRRFEGEETFQVRLANPTSEAAFGLSLSTVNIADDEPFIPLKANYTGLIQVMPYDHALSGTLKINATGNGSFTGSLMIGGNAAVPFSGAFNAAGKSTITITRKTGGNVLLNLTYADNGNRIRALVSVNGKTADIQTWRIIFGGAVEINDKPFAFTARIAKPHNATGDVPQADGFLTITVGIKGEVKIAGVLPDDSIFTAAGPLAGYDVFPLYAALNGGKGSFCCDLLINENMVDTSAAAWFKMPNSKDKSFKNGFIQYPAVETSPYKFSKRDPILAAVQSTQGVADFFAKGPGLPVNGITQIFRLMEDNSIALPLNPQVKLTLKFAPATGTFTGTYQVTTEKPTPFKGAVFQWLEFASGFTLTPGVGSVLTNGTVEFMPAY